ncbi:hypothetical protein DSO57_1006702 [Entomophthora muscae]|uniref:Uncharacterized protein n=1 Tax=Entomophthora muscae TaxID=34485 RepID=A0ACC2UHR3_9FUNG|nr:hypothetical protein DSO57_1006702 [Entomophthora muscae]
MRFGLGLIISLVLPVKPLRGREVAVLLLYSKKPVCSGARYGRNMILTTSSCIMHAAKEYEGVVGIPEGMVTFKVQQIIRHPLQSLYHSFYDIAILKTNGLKPPDTGLRLPSTDSTSQGLVLIGWTKEQLREHKASPHQLAMRNEPLSECKNNSLEMLYPYIVLCGKPEIDIPTNFSSKPGSPLVQLSGETLVIVGLLIPGSRQAERVAFTKVFSAHQWIEDQSN